MILVILGACDPRRLGLPGVDTSSPVENLGLIKLAPSGPTVPGDGVSVVTITAVLDTRAMPVGEQVTFTTTMGTWLGSTTSSITLSVDSSGVARALLRAPADVGTAIITATVAGITLTTQVAIQSAEPTRVQVTLDPATIAAKSTSFTTVTATPFRIAGSVTPGVWVVFTAMTLDSLGRDSLSTGRFSTNPVFIASTGGTATTKFVPTDTSAARIRIRANVVRSSTPPSVTSTDSSTTGTATLTVTKS